MIANSETRLSINVFSSKGRKKDMVRRTTSQMMTLIRNVALHRHEVQAVILEGSKANDIQPVDDFQDFDLLFLVDQIQPFLSDPDWIDVFGPRLIMQKPTEMELYGTDPRETGRYTYLMLFADLNRIDLTLCEIGPGDTIVLDDPFEVILDKTQILDRMSLSTRSYVVMPPSQKEFEDCCNEFWWVVTYVVKGICRTQPFYARHMLEAPVREMFIRMLGWTAGVRRGFPLNPGKAGKLLGKFFPSEEWQAILYTCSDHRPENMWKALFQITDIFHEYAREVAKILSLKYNTTEAENVRKYLEYLRATY